MRTFSLQNRTELEPGIRHFLDEMRAAWTNYPPFESMSFPEQREAAARVRAPWCDGGPEMATTVERTLDMGGGALPLRIHVPRGVAQPAPALIYLHGGGFTLFSIDTHDRLMREYAERGGFAVIGVDYPLSPEAKYPEALGRIEALMLWLEHHGAELGIDPGRLAMGGDSAGANLSFATFKRLRARGKGSLVRAILSNYGAFSATVSDQAEAQFGGPGSILDRAELAQYFANYFSAPSDADDPLACPLHADLTDFPPVFLVIPERDILTEQSLEIEARLRAAGAVAESKIYPGATHSFLEAMSVSALAREAIQDGATFVRGRL